MKKIFYLICFTVFSALTITSCTDEDVKPTKESSNGGANGIGDVLR